MNNIDKYDDELQKMKRTEIKASINFKSAYLLIQRVIEEKGEYDEHYPKDGLLKLWGCSMAVMLLLFTFSHSLLTVATIPFMFFYMMVIFKVFNAFKIFGYKRGWLITATVIGLCIEAVAGYYIQQLIFFGS